MSVGNASGPVPPVAPLRLGPKNLKRPSHPPSLSPPTSLIPVLPSVSRPVLNQALYTIEEFKHYSTQLFDLVNQGVFKMSVWEEYPLSTEGITKAQVDISEYRCHWREIGTDESCGCSEQEDVG